MEISISGGDIGGILTALALVVTAFGSAWSAITTSRTARKVNEQALLLIKHGAAIEEVHIATNSMKDELVLVTEKGAFSAGKLEGKAEQRDQSSLERADRDIDRAADRVTDRAADRLDRASERAERPIVPREDLSITDVKIIGKMEEKGIKPKIP